MKKTEEFRILSDEIIDRYRPLPFWSWNDELDPEVLRRQVRQMHAAGLGGFFMHARGGLKTPYLSGRWMECVSAALDEAAACGIAGWLYDENGWPSGFGNGMVNSAGKDFQQKFLRYETVDASAVKGENTIAFYTLSGGLLGRELPAGTAGRVIRCYYSVNPCYVDNLKPEVVAAFLRCTHEYYLEKLPPEHLAHLKGIFTDEPQLSRDGFPWSEVLEEEYLRRCRRQLLEDLPGLFMDLPESSRIRVDFWRMVTEIFRDSYIRQISRWCREHNWQLTGHHLAEEKPLDQIIANGSLMAQYPEYDIPGTDHLCRIKPDLVVMIQLVSAALQSGKKQILTESFGLAGWNLNFHGMYWLYHQQLACGINLLCQHLSSYSLKGLRKRDYPGSYFIHQPWWNDYSQVNDHFAFAGAAIASGRVETRLAVLHPLSTGWRSFDGGLRNETAEYCNGALTALTEALMADFQEFHFVDETLFAENGSVAGDGFKVGCCTYSAVLIPPLNNLSGETAAALKEFHAAGGSILRMASRFAAEQLTVDGIPADKDMLSFWRELPEFSSINAVVNHLDRMFPRRIRVVENGCPSRSFTGICRRLDGENILRKGNFYLIANGDYCEGHQVTISLPDTGMAVEVISNDGKHYSPLAGAEKRGGNWQFPWRFAPGCGEMFFVPDREISGEETVSAADPVELPPVKVLSGEFQLDRVPDNLLLLDRCRYRVDGGEWVCDDVSVIHQRLLAQKRDCRLEMEFTFEISPDFDLSLPLSIIAETPERFTFSLNGETFTPSDEGEFFDQAFRRIPLPFRCRCGVNTLNMTMDFHESEETYRILERAKIFETEYNRLTFDSEVESIFLCGAFTVRHRGEVEKLDRGAHRFKGDFILASQPEAMTVSGENLATQGFPFFAGSIDLYKEFFLSESEVEKISHLRFVPAGANSFRIRINGEYAGMLFQGNFALPVKHLLHPGKNRLQIGITTSLRNMLGPHHLAEGESYRVTTLSFSKEANAVGWQGPEFTDGCCLVDTGLQDAVLC